MARFVGATAVLDESLVRNGKPISLLSHVLATHRRRVGIPQPSDTFVVHASTQEGCVVLQRGNGGSVELKLRPGGPLVIDVRGRDKPMSSRRQ